MAAKDESKNRSRLHGLTRKSMDRATSGAEASAVATHLFFRELTITVADVATAVTGANDGNIQGAGQQFDADAPPAVVSEALDPTLQSVATLTPDLATVVSAALDPDTVPGEAIITLAQLASIASGALDPDLIGSSRVSLGAFVRAARGATSDLGTSIIASLPNNLPASLTVLQPAHIPAYIRGGYSDVSDLGASLVQAGAYVSLTAFIKVLDSASSDIGATIDVAYPGDLRAILHGFITADLGASLVTERHKNLQAIILGKVSAISNFGAFMRQDINGTKDMGVEAVKAVHSTHTSDKAINLQKVERIFNENRFLFGTRARGLAAFTIEPIYGNFPDLHALITATPFSINSISALIRPAVRSTSNVPTSVIGVNPHIKINKITLRPQPLKELAASLNSRGGYLDMPVLIRGAFSGSTGTAENAAYQTTATSHRFILGTSRGLYVPQQAASAIRTTIFNNPHPNPDLRASLRAWQVGDIGAYIKVYTLAHLSAEIDSIGPDRFRDFRATVEPAYISDVSASVTPGGSYTGLSASIQTSGGITALAASIVSFINPLSYNAIAVSTKPFKDMGALINYGSLVSCASSSQIASLTAYIKGFEIGDDDRAANFGASLNALSLVTNMSAEIIGRKVTRIRTLTLNFRASTRGSSSMLSSIVPLVMHSSDMLATIRGLSHEINFTASITPVRYALEDVLFTATEHARDLARPENFKDILLSFRSKVSSYVYEEISQAVYATERGTWAIDLRTVARQESFFDRDPNSREKLIAGVEEFYSLDEAIRNAVSMICDGVQSNFGASITVAGGSSNLRVVMGITPSDKFSDMRSKLVPVYALPDLSASINTGPGSSGYLGLSSTLNAGGFDSRATIGASIVPGEVKELSAELTVI